MFWFALQRQQQKSYTFERCTMTRGSADPLSANARALWNLRELFSVLTTKGYVWNFHIPHKTTIFSFSTKIMKIYIDYKIYLKEWRNNLTKNWLQSITIQRTHINTINYHLLITEAAKRYDVNFCYWIILKNKRVKFSGIQNHYIRDDYQKITSLGIEPRSDAT